MTSRANKQTNMANFTSAINALVAERDRVFLLRVSEDYKIPFEELQQKYLETAEQAIKVPRTYKKRDAKSVTVVSVNSGEPVKAPKGKGEKQCCTAHTSKKEPCKFGAIKGEVFCKRHLKQSLGESSADKPASPKPVKKAAKPPQPMHTHSLTDTAVDACELCQSHGNPLEVAEMAFEVVRAPHTGPIKVPTVEQRLAAMLDAADEDVESEEDDVSLSEEEFEEDD